MERQQNGDAAPCDLPQIDLNELLFTHPAACFVFDVAGDLIIVNRALAPDYDSLILASYGSRYAIEPYTGQPAWGVITHLIKPVR